MTTPISRVGQVVGVGGGYAALFPTPISAAAGKIIGLGGAVVNAVAGTVGALISAADDLEWKKITTPELQEVYRKEADYRERGGGW